MPAQASNMQCHDPEQKAQRQSSAVTHENRGGMKVIDQKTGECSGNHKALYDRLRVVV